MNTKPNSNQDGQDYAWVQQRRRGNVRIVWYLVAFCLAITLYSGWGFLRFMEQRTGYARPENSQQQDQTL